MEVTLDQVLRCREERAERQRDLIQRFSKPVISFCMNIAGPVKTDNLIERGFRTGLRSLEGSLLAAGAGILSKQVLYSVTGPEAFFCVDMPALKLKEITCRIEDRDSLGRLFDLDVIKTDFSKVERAELGKPERKCLICGNEAKVCSSRRIHSVKELQERTRSILENSVPESEAELIAFLAVKALLCEVYITPKPGLVDRANNGSHPDMDMLSFAGSAAVLHSYFKKACLTGDSFKDLRNAGLEAEEKMFLETRGVNTHKGAVFTMGIVCAATGLAIAEGNFDTSVILDQCAKLASGIVNRDLGSLDSGSCKTAGQRLFAKYGITGIRGEMEKGLPSVRDYGLPVLEKLISEGHSWDEAGSNALLAILANITDTNMVSRGGLEKAQKASAQAKELVGQGFVSLDKMRELDLQYQKENLSPGGAADLLAVCCFLHFAKEAFSV